MPTHFHLDGDTETFTAHSLSDPDWNGWVVPNVDRTTLDAVLTRVNALSDERTLRLTGHPLAPTVLTLVETDRHDGQTLSTWQMHSPQPGLYQLDGGLTFLTADPDPAPADTPAAATGATHA